MFALSAPELTTIPVLCFLSSDVRNDAKKPKFDAQPLQVTHRFAPVIFSMVGLAAVL